MADVTVQECLVLAALSRLRLTDAEVEGFQRQLARIVGYLDKLQSVDVAGVPEFLPPERIGSGLRADTPEPGADPTQVLAAAPEVRGGQVVVPKFKED